MTPGSLLLGRYRVLEELGAAIGLTVSGGAVRTPRNVEAPLLTASGAGHEMRQALGTAVFSGMLGVTIFGIFLTPVFYSVIQMFGKTPVVSKSTFMSCWVRCSIKSSSRDSLGMTRAWLPLGATT